MKKIWKYLTVSAFVLFSSLVENLVKPIRDAIIEGFWKEHLEPFLSEHASPMVTSMFNHLSGFFYGSVFTLLTVGLVEIAFWAFGHKKERSAPVRADFMVCNMQVSVNSLASDSIVVLSIVFLNASRKPIVVHSITGDISVQIMAKDSGKQPIMNKEALPNFVYKNDIKANAQYEMYLDIEQRVQGKIAKTLIEGLALERRIQFVTDNLDINLAFKDNPTKYLRLDIWNGVSVQQTLARTHSNKLLIIKSKNSL